MVGTVIPLLRRVGSVWRLDLLVEGGDGLPVAIFLGDRDFCLGACSRFAYARALRCDFARLGCYGHNDCRIDPGPNDDGDVPPQSERRPIRSVQ